MDKIKDILGTEALENLKKDGFATPQALVMLDVKNLEEITNLPRVLVKNAQLAASEDILRGKIFKASHNTQKEILISTGCDSIDSILEGGFPANGICEISAPSGAGKTQICLQLSLEAQLLQKEVVYIATEGPFPTKRLNQLAEMYRKKHKTFENFPFESHIFLKHVTGYPELEKCLEKEFPVLLKTKKIGLIIIDSITSLFRGEEDQPDYISRSLNILKVATNLNRIQDEYGCAVVISNQVADNPETGTWQPCLGLAWSNQVTYRFLLERKSDQSPLREFRVGFAPDLPEKRCEFVITEKGVVNF